MLKLSAVYCFFVILLIFELSNGQNYCSICKDHTLCKPHYSTPNCHATVKSYGLTQAQKNIILTEHNNYRQKVAAGREERGANGQRQLPAKYMPNLTWDNELALIAQTWANNCVYAHDTCRNVKRYQVGQNIAKGWAINSPVLSLQGMIKAWYDEVALFDPRLVNNFVFQKKYGHYSQLVWAKTTKIGCGFVEYMDGNKDTVVFVCDYGPSGNFPNQKVYEVRK